ncbi:TIGR02253 family HAD-type hydrolase [Methanobrevibacter filiformis]|uniref:Glyceraldehyde 3-phosphate phosphatase n=1 Tax=Methanobrevibacter filiformis TaxID=55758 RepID=A0A166DAP4_9EURY|nr:TIGR02253 family HAD-type hydrolase [Methanobrevibacter filiformis]KZX15386.1 pyrimidine 5'-nucleotidase YjjG [Methanobrevibacter filiformis]
MDKVVFFDIDDTLLDTSNFAKIAREAAINAMVDNGLDLTNEEAYNLLKEIIAQKGSNYDKHFNVLTKTVYGEENYKLIASGMITYHNVKFALLRPFPRTNEVLIHLKTKGYKLAVISNGITIKQWEKLVRMNLHPFFDKIITSEEVGFEKPNKRIFEEALNAMNCSSENSIMIGNKFKEDAMGGVNAGMSSILVNSKVTDEERKKIIDENINIQIIDNIDEVDSIL